MKKLTLGLTVIAILFASSAFSSCGDRDEILLSDEKPLPKPPKGGVNVENIVVTFKNGWEDSADLKDDPFTDYKSYRPVSPAKLHPIVKIEEKAVYDAALAEYKRIKEIWTKYDKERENNPENPPEPPVEDLPPEPIPPIATLPYFPGDEYISEDDEIVVAGNQPEWDYHTFLGWKLEAGESEDNEITLHTPITKNITIVAQWAPAPARPFKTITFNRNAGSGEFEKRIAVPSTILYETETETGMTRTKTINGEETTVFVTDDKGARKSGGKVFYEDYLIQAKDIEGTAIVQNDPLIPVFTREHYTVKSGAEWADLNGENPINAGGILSYKFMDDKNLYQQWSAKTFTINFAANAAINKENIAPMTVSEPLAASGGVSADGKTLPSYSKSEITKDDIVYVFRNWADAEQGGNVITGSTPIMPKEGERAVTLYAQWGVKGAQTYSYSYTGKSNEWTVPLDGVYKIEAWGAGGRYGGNGGYISGDIALTKGQKLYVYCGGQGGQNDGNAMTMPGGWNGGGEAGGATHGNGGGGGHGATDVRTVRASGADTNWNDATSIASRIIVAGGGAGHGWAGAGAQNKHGTGGNGGLGIAGGGKGFDNDKNGYGNGGTLTGPGAGSTGYVSNGSGGNGVTGGKGGKTNRGGGGGGGGYYGGAGGACAGATRLAAISSRGGGGSSWAKLDGAGLKFIKDSLAPNPEAGGGTNNGPGKVTITYVRDK